MGMRLKKLEIYGFKSFAERVEISFDNGITGIVGPNGCGKSNISDAVRWVLGEQSAKTLRGAKMEDVIFSGTEKRRRLSYCEVILTFDNEDHALSIDFAEVAVSRRVYRNGDSEYAINRAPCRLKDVVELFRDTGIGKEGYSLIGQGRIDEILSVKSEDRRQIFEEAAGIVKYKARKTEAERRMENTRMNLSRVEDILTELNLRVEPLREQSEVAREYLQLRDELKQLELNVFLARSERYTARIEELTRTVEELSKAIEDVTARRQAISDSRESVQNELGELESTAAEVREEVQQLIRDVEAREGVSSVLRERIANATRDQERLTGELNAAKEGEGGVEKKLDFLAEQIGEEQEQILLSRERFARDEKELAVKESALSKGEEEIETAKSELIEAMNRISDVRSEQARLNAMKDALTSRIESMISDESRDAGQTADFESRLIVAKERLATEQEEKAKLDALAKDTADRVRIMGEQSEELTERHQNLLSKRQETASRLHVLEEMQRDYDGYNNSVKNVLLQARRLPNSGVHGVVATIVRVPKELERAIDMVLGGALQNVVVDREEDAKRMIEYLRNNRMGRATFLPISSVRGRTLDQNERRVLDLPGCVGLASELIDYDPQYKGVINNLLGRTVIAEDLDAGIAIMRAGRHAFRLVTLNGDVMHSGGSMTGGSVQSRVTSLLSREREVDEHKRLLSQIEQRLGEAKSEMDALEKLRGDLKRERAGLFDRVHQQEIACAREEAHVKAAQDELNGHLERAQRVEGARGQMEEQLTDILSSLDAMSGAQQNEEDRHAYRQSDIARMQQEIASVREEVQALRQSVSDERVALAARERGLDALISDRNRLSSQRKDLNKLLAESAEALELCEAQLKQDNEQLAIDENELIRAKQALEESRIAFSAADARRTKAQDDLREMNEQIERLRVESEDITDRHHRGEMQLSRVEAEFKQLTDRIWEDYELTYEGAEAHRVEDFKLTDSEKRIAQIRSRIREMGSVNVSAVDEYRQTMERYTELSEQRDDLLKAELDLQGIVEELVRKMEKQFKTQFELLNENFQETFVRLFGGGHAELRLADPKDALNCGIDIVAQPPGKKLQMLSLLSGGERALTAIAILFAMLKLKPTPFCFLDEIEAALDDANIDNYADYLRDYSRNTQFVVVTHRKGTMERCDALYGVAMEEKGISRLVSVRLSEEAG